MSRGSGGSDMPQRNRNNLPLKNRLIIFGSGHSGQMTCLL